MKRLDWFGAVVIWSFSLVVWCFFVVHIDGCGVMVNVGGIWSFGLVLWCIRLEAYDGPVVL